MAELDQKRAVDIGFGVGSLAVLGALAVPAILGRLEPEAKKYPLIPISQLKSDTNLFGDLVRIEGGTVYTQKITARTEFSRAIPSHEAYDSFYLSKIKGEDGEIIYAVSTGQIHPSTTYFGRYTNHNSIPEIDEALEKVGTNKFFEIKKILNPDTQKWDVGYTRDRSF